jgi:hypothetical protein
VREHVHLQPRVAVVGADLLDQLVQALCGPDVVETEIVRVDVEAAAVVARLHAGAAVRIAPHLL